MDLCDCFSLYFVQISGQKIRQSYKQGIFICHTLQNTAEYRFVIYTEYALEGENYIEPMQIRIPLS